MHWYGSELGQLTGVIVINFHDIPDPMLLRGSVLRKRKEPDLGRYMNGYVWMESYTDL